MIQLQGIGSVPEDRVVWRVRDNTRLSNDPISDEGQFMVRGGQVAPIPEPSSVLLFCTGALVVGVALRRQRSLTL